MTPLENLHYAIGELAYVIALADGEIQPEERTKFHEIVSSELKREDYDFDISDIIFTLMDRKRASHDLETTYTWVVNEIKLNGHYLSPGLKRTFIRVMEKIAEAYPPVTVEEKTIIERFKADIVSIEGDPVYYGPQ